jgi:type I restriction enzyme S subunit
MESIIDYRGKTPEKSTSGIPLVTAKVIKGGRIETPNEFIAPEAYDEWMRRGIPEAGDVVITTEAPLGEIAQLPKAKVALAQRVITLRGKRDAVDNTYLKYLLLSKPFQEDLQARATGTTVVGIKQSVLRKIGLTFPGLSQQKAVAHILGTLDDKIELNRKANETLEAMARALFKSWFVDFDPVRAKSEGRPTGLPDVIGDLFPDSFEESELGEVPRGWRVSPLGELLDVDKGVSYKGDFLSDAEGLPMVNLGCFAGGGAFRHEKMKFYTGDYRERHMAKAEDLLIANTDMTQNRIILGAPVIIPPWRGHEKFLFSHHVFAVRFKREKNVLASFIYFTLLRPTFRQVAAGHATGTTVLALPRDGITDYQAVLPPNSILICFTRQVDALWGKCQMAAEENTLLARMRDTLLPKLVSGELRIPEAERLLEEAGG